MIWLWIDNEINFLYDFEYILKKSDFNYIKFKSITEFNRFFLYEISVIKKGNIGFILEIFYPLENKLYTDIVKHIILKRINFIKFPIIILTQFNTYEKQDLNYFEIYCKCDKNCIHFFSKEKEPEDLVKLMKKLEKIC